MAYIYNATNEEQSVKACGNWYTFKPKQMKMIWNENIANFLAQERSDHGLMPLSDKFEDPEYKKTPEGKAELEAADDAGIENYLRYHRMIIYNNQVSLRQDLEKANMKVDPAAMASPGEIHSMQLVAKYQKASEDVAHKKIAQVKELMEKVGPLK